MAVFPRRPDLRSDADIKDYIRYMVERTEFAAANIEKRVAAIEKKLEEEDNGE